MNKYYCDICGLEVEPEENKNKLEIRLVKRGRLKSEGEEIHFCDECGKRLNLEPIRKALILIPYDEKRKADE